MCILRAWKIKVFIFSHTYMHILYVCMYVCMHIVLIKHTVHSLYVFFQKHGIFPLSYVKPKR